MVTPSQIIKQGNRLLSLRPDGEPVTWPRMRLKLYDDPHLMPGRDEYQRPALQDAPGLDPLAYYAHLAQLRPDSKADVRDTILALCKLVHASEELTDAIYRPYASGFWRYSDGTSWLWWKLTPLASLSRQDKDPVAVMHDDLWYRGEDFRKSNRMFREALITFGRSRPVAWLMWLGVSGITGRRIYDRHARRRRQIPGYGTDDYLTVLREIGWPD